MVWAAAARAGSFTRARDENRPPRRHTHVRHPLPLQTKDRHQLSFSRCPPPRSTAHALRAPRNRLQPHRPTTPLACAPSNALILARGLLCTQPSAKPRTSCVRSHHHQPHAHRLPSAAHRPRPCPALRPRTRRPLRSSCRITAQNANAWTTLDDTRRPLRPLTSLPRRAATRQSPFNRAPRPLRPAPR